MPTPPKPRSRRQRITLPFWCGPLETCCQWWVLVALEHILGGWMMVDGWWWLNSNLSIWRIWGMGIQWDIDINGQYHGINKARRKTCWHLIQVSYSQDGKNLIKFHSSYYRFNSWVYGIGVVTRNHKIDALELGIKTPTRESSIPGQHCWYMLRCSQTEPLRFIS